MKKLLKAVLLCSLIFSFVFGLAATASSLTVTAQEANQIASDDALDFWVRS